MKRLVIVLGLLLISSLCFAGAFEDLPSEKSSEEPRNGPGSAASVFAQVSKSVVIVEALFPDGRVQGSAVVYHNNSGKDREFGAYSYAVSNAHVVKNASSVLIIQGDKYYKAVVDYIDDEFDLALLCIHGVLLSTSPPFSGQVSPSFTS